MCLLVFYSCEEDEFEPYPQQKRIYGYEVEIVNDSFEPIYGKWELLGINHWGLKTKDLPFETLELTPIGKYKILNRAGILEEGLFVIYEQSGNEIMVNFQDSKMIKNRLNYLYLRDQHTLFVGYPEQYDAPEYRFVRK